MLAQADISSLPQPVGENVSPRTTAGTCQADSFGQLYADHKSSGPESEHGDQCTFPPGNPTDSISEPAVGPLKDSHEDTSLSAHNATFREQINIVSVEDQPGSQNEDGGLQGRDKFRTLKLEGPSFVHNQDKESISQGHRVLNGRISKSKTKRPNHANASSSMETILDESAPSTEQILQLYLRNIQKEKQQTSRRHREMKSQIEQLVRVNNDYQRRLDEAEQELDEREGQILEQSAETKQWKEQVLRIKKTLGDTMEDQVAQKQSFDVLNKALAVLPSEIKGLRDGLEECQATMSSLKDNTTKSMRLAAQSHHDELLSIQTKFKLVKEDFKERASQLTQQKARCARLEEFSQNGMEVLMARETLTARDVEPFWTKLCALESMMKHLDHQTTRSRGNVNVHVPGLDQCSKLLKSLVETQASNPSDTQSINSFVGRVEERYVL